MHKRSVICVGTTVDRMLLADGVRKLLERSCAHADITGFESTKDAIAYMEEMGVPTVVIVHAGCEAGNPAAATARFLIGRKEIRRLVVHASSASNDMVALADGEPTAVIDPSEGRELLCRAVVDVLFRPQPEP